MSPKAVRIAVALVCIGGIAGMIVGSIADNNGIAITFGLIMATATLCLILVTAVSGPDGYTSGQAHAPITDEAAAEQVERQVEALVSAGADESQVRDLVGDAIRLGRDARRQAPRDRALS